MAKTATLKDVLYALEFLGARLCRWPQHNPSVRAAWSLEPGGAKVPPHVADEARRVASVARFANRPDGYDEYRWAAAA